ncbi:hypothetical protein [Microbacterium sp. NPDC086615]|uniref:hypothetical protein n=1 Tax=Microbacterium sp. NPDC086615 TaxID=3154865 RepID=UPI0034193FF8
MIASAAPPVVERLDDYLHRRSRSGLPLSPGEVVTLAVGVLRGCHRAEDRSHRGFWALTARGCPTLLDEGEGEGDDVLAETARVLARLADMTDRDGRPLVERARDTVLTDPPRAWEEAERRLFAWADPVPLVLGPLAPIVAADTGPVRAPAASASGFLTTVDADVATMVAEAVRDVREKLRRVRHLRWITFGAVAVATALVLGLLLPSSAPASIPAGDPGPSATTWADEEIPDATPPATPTPSGHPTVLDLGGTTHLLDVQTRTPAPSETSADGEIVASARALLELYAACAGEPGCEQRLREGRAAGDDETPMNPAVADITLVDDFGGLAVFRLDAGDRRQYVTLVRDKDRWLVRAVRSGTDQPS